jgi:hypothetical protein
MLRLLAFMAGSCGSAIGPQRILLIRLTMCHAMCGCVALTFIAPNFWTFTKIGKTGRCSSVENYCGKTMTRASALDLWGTFLGCVQRVWVFIMVSVSKPAVTRAPTIALAREL